jgi:hypothetical protein
MSLAEARRTTAPLALPLPTYPPGLGEPDYVFVQDMQAWAAILVWMDPEQPGRIRLSLHIIEPGGFAVDKVNPETVEETQVNGLPAFWTTGPYVVRLHGDELDVRRLIEGHVLIWEEDGVTYRVETDLPLEEAVKIAESLEP